MNLLEENKTTYGINYIRKNLLGINSVAQEIKFLSLNNKTPKAEQLKFMSDRINIYIKQIEDILDVIEDN